MKIKNVLPFDKCWNHDVEDSTKVNIVDMVYSTSRHTCIDGRSVVDSWIGCYYLLDIHWSEEDTVEEAESIFVAFPIESFRALCCTRFCHTFVVRSHSYRVQRKLQAIQWRWWGMLKYRSLGFCYLLERRKFRLNDGGEGVCWFVFGWVWLGLTRIDLFNRQFAEVFGAQSTNYKWSHSLYPKCKMLVKWQLSIETKCF